MTRRIRVHVKGKKYVYAIVSDHRYNHLRKFLWYLNECGYAIHYYRRNKVYGRFSMHRYIMGCHKGDGIEIDHIDRNRLNNVDENLRRCTRNENVRNASKRKDNTSGYIGVSCDKEVRKWHAIIQHNGKQKTIGRFDDKREAALAYDKVAREQRGEFAVLNFPRLTDNK